MERPYRRTWATGTFLPPTRRHNQQNSSSIKHRQQDLPSHSVQKTQHFRHIDFKSCCQCTVCSGRVRVAVMVANFWIRKEKRRRKACSHYLFASCVQLAKVYFLSTNINQCLLLCAAVYISINSKFSIFLKGITTYPPIVSDIILPSLHW